MTIKISIATCSRCPTWQVMFADHDDLAKAYAEDHRKTHGRKHIVHMEYKSMPGTYRVPKTMPLLDHRGRVIPRRGRRRGQT